MISSDEEEIETVDDGGKFIQNFWPDTDEISIPQSKLKERIESYDYANTINHFIPYTSIHAHSY